MVVGEGNVRRIYGMGCVLGRKTGIRHCTLSILTLPDAFCKTRTDPSNATKEMAGPAVIGAAEKWATNGG
jgi:hypothetical protein